MLNELREWEMVVKHEDLFDINAALSEVVWEHEAASVLPKIDYSELEHFDSVSINFEVPRQESLPTGLGIASIDQLMNPAFYWTDETNYSGVNHDYSINEAEQSDNVSITYPDAGWTARDLLTALQEANLNTINFLDPTRAQWEVPQLEDYHPSQLFSYEGVDIDSYDSISIKMPETNAVPAGSSPDWPAVFADIERYVANVLTEDISDVLVNDIHYKPSRSGMTLVRGKGRSKSKGMFSGFEQDYAVNHNILNFNESHEWYWPARPFSIPMQLYMENGELIFKVNLAGLDLRDLQELNHLSHEVNMKSVLSLLPHRKAK